MQNRIHTQFVYFEIETKLLFHYLIECLHKDETPDESRILKHTTLYTNVNGDASIVTGDAIKNFVINLHPNQYLSYSIVPKKLESAHEVRFTNVFFQQGIDQVLSNVSAVQEMVQMINPINFIIQGLPSFPANKAYAFSLQVEIQYKEVITRFQIDPRLKVKQSDEPNP